jgi:carbonic anhydrase/acetyltransferase-like protein (isoleucine patch superfamily)
MPLYALGDRTPSIHPDAFIHPDAVIIGDVHVGAESSVWPSAVLRGDYGTIIVGERTSIQDGAIIHAVAAFPTVIGNDCVIGHLAHLEGCVIEDRALVGSGAVVLHQATVHSGATVGAGAVVRNRMDVPANALAVGVPAVIKPDSSGEDGILENAATYVANARRYKKELRAL